MNFHRKKRRKIDITLISMIDVLFVLLLFFMVSTTFNRQTRIKVKLPEASGSEADEQKAVELIIDADGVYYLQGADGLPHELINQQPGTLKRELQKIANHSAHLPFIISADGRTPHQSVITALDMAGQAGFTHITFEAKQPDTGK
ncbi:MAG: ExbD/TolR family protein [Gammaproteobacteria bacterium]